MVTGEVNSATARVLWLAESRSFIRSWLPKINIREQRVVGEVGVADNRGTASVEGATSRIFGSRSGFWASVRGTGGVHVIGGFSPWIVAGDFGHISFECALVDCDATGGKINGTAA